MPKLFMAGASLKDGQSSTPFLDRPIRGYYCREDCASNWAFNALAPNGTQPDISGTIRMRVDRPMQVLADNERYYSNVFRLFQEVVDVFNAAQPKAEPLSLSTSQEILGSAFHGRSEYTVLSLTGDSRILQTWWWLVVVNRIAAVLRGWRNLEGDVSRLLAASSSDLAWSHRSDGRVGAAIWRGYVNGTVAMPLDVPRDRLFAGPHAQLARMYRGDIQFIRWFYDTQV
jgi:hypothetical protein